MKTENTKIDSRPGMGLNTAKRGINSSSSSHPYFYKGGDQQHN
jgi:hypothetical protein